MNCGQVSNGILNVVGCFIYDFQTLLTGILAIVAALLAGIPVWRQLKDSNLQTRISHRETLAALLRDLLARHSKIDKAMREPLSNANRVIADHRGEPVKIDPQHAHSLEGEFSGVLDWYLVDLVNTDHKDIETHKAKLKAHLDKLMGTLSDAHWVHHNEQCDEYNSYSNTEWAEILARSEKARVEASERVSEMSACYRELREAQKRWVRALRERIAELDRQIIGSK